VLGALRGELVDGLITDASLALALLSEPRKP
jgi:DNA-binding transcriptional regulator LsrR (DeoR family)